MFDSEVSYDFHAIIGDESECKNFASFLKTRGKKLPVFEKGAGEKISDPDFLADDDFALIVKQANQIHRYFPLDTPQSAWLSQQSFLYNSAKLPISCVANTALFIKKACEFYGLEVEKEIKEHARYNFSQVNQIDLDDPMIKQAEESFRKTQPREVFFALESEKRFPLNTRTEVVEAINYFEKNHEEMYSEKVASEYAQNLKKGCARQKVSVPDLVWEYTSDCVTTNEGILKTAFDERVKYFESKLPEEHEIETAKLAYDTILSAFRYNPPRKIVELIKTADQKLLGVFGYDNMLSPEQLVFEGFKLFNKTASFQDLEGFEGIGSVGDELNDERIYNSGSQEVAQSEEEKKEKIKDVMIKYPDAFKGHFDEKIVDDLNSDFELAFSNMSAYDRDKMFDVARRFE